MQIETLRDILHWTASFHQQLSECLSHCADNNTDQRARMMLQYLSEHENRLRKVVSGFEATGAVDALNTWCIEYLQKHPIVRHQQCNAPFKDLDATQVMNDVINQHQQVIELYRYLASRADIPSAQHLLDALSALEEHEVMLMVQAGNRFSDM